MPRVSHARRPVAVVTGAAHGIGEAIAKQFSDHGYAVAGIDVDTKGLERLARWAKARHRPLLTVVHDVGNVGQHRHVARRIRKRLGPLTALVNAAGIGVSRTFRRTAPEAFDRVFRTNLRGPFFFTQALVHAMPRGAAIVFITSVHQDEPVGDPTYSMSKAALKILVKELALELAPRTIRVNGVAPGAIRNRVRIALRFQPVPLGGRRGTPEEIARVVAFLCSPDASYITGELVTVDAGLSLVNWTAASGTPQ